VPSIYSPLPLIALQTTIVAPINIVFDLSRSIDFHQISTQHTREKAISGRTEGLIELGESVEWKAKHFGLWLTLTSKITEFDRPAFFVDEMVKGAFHSFRHEHRFEEKEDQTIMTDSFDYRSPLGWLGQLADVLFLKNYMTQLLVQRNAVLKRHAEGKEGAMLLEKSVS